MDMTTYLDFHLKGLPFDTRQEIHKRMDAVGVRAMENCLQAPDGYPGWRRVGYNDDDLARHLEKIKEDTERDNFMTAEQAKAYGLVDEVMSKH